MRAICIGEVLWDVLASGEHLGGAPFNFAAHLSRLGHEVSFISAVGSDPRGQRVLDRMDNMGLPTRYVRRDPEHETGAASVEVNSAGQPQFVIHRPAAYDFPQLSIDDFKQLFLQPVDLIYFGTLHQLSPVAKQLTGRLLEAAGAAHKFYDLNLRPDSYDAKLLQELMSQASIVKMNDEEVVKISEMFGYPEQSLESFSRYCAGRFGWEAVCITRGPRGCALLIGEEFIEAPGYAVRIADTVGAGDAFAAAFIHGLSSGWPTRRIADFANRVGALIASRHGALPEWTIAEVESLNPKSEVEEPA